jgi:CheY-like chemotaxis protein
MRAALEAHRETDLRSRTLIWQAAVDVAELLDLPGLAELLTACAAHAADPPLAVKHVIERLERMARETEKRGDLSAFTRADKELAALAGTLATQEWSNAPSAEPPVPVQPLGDLVGDLPLDHPDSVTNAKVTLPVAAALRAALDWTGADSGGVVRVNVHDAALTLTARITHEPGLGPAGAVLALSGGALLPEPDGRWALRVPLHVERPAYLLARQGRLSLALPWHAVARLRIADDTARAVMTEPSLSPWSPLERTAGERPAALLALGLTRAWLHLDHIVWRVFARPEPAEPLDAVPGGRHVVRTSDGGEYWVVDVAEALAGVPSLVTPPVQPRPRVEAAPAPAVVEPELELEFPAPRDEATPATAPEQTPAGDSQERSAPEPVLERVLEPSAVTPIAAPRPDAPIPVTPAAEPPRVPELRVLGAGDVRPRGRALAPEPEIAPVAAPEPPAAGAVTEPAPGPADPLPAAGVRPVPGRRALIVDDSLIARLTLGRVLENEGWAVEWVERAAEMWEALRESEWHAVFVDVSLPDASGRAHLQALTGVPRAFEMIALTREPAEDRMARASGVRHVLRKPFDPEHLEQFVRRLARTTDRT